MRRQAKAPSAFTHGHGASGAAALAAMLLALLLGAPKAQAGLQGDHFFGSLGTSAGQFDDPTGVAINNESTIDSHDGFVYVADDNHRVQVFDSNESFQFMFGGDVIKAGAAGNIPANAQQAVTVVGDGGSFGLLVPSGFSPTSTLTFTPRLPPVNELQAVEVVGEGGTFALRVLDSHNSVVSANPHGTVEVVATGGTFTLRLGSSGQQTTPIPFNATAAEVETAVEGLPQVGVGHVEVTGPAGGPWDLEFIGVSAGIDRGVNTNLTGSPKSVTVFGGQQTAPLPRNATSAELDAALEALDKVGAGNVNVTGPAGGPWNVEFTGSLALLDVGAMSASATALTGGTKSAEVLNGELASGIARNASAAEVDTALETLSRIGAGNVNVTGPAGGPWNVEFTGTLADTFVNRISGRTTNLTGASKSVTVTAIAPGGSAEVCAVAADCQAGTPSFPGGMLDDPRGVAIDQATGHVFVHDFDNRRVQEFEADGSFVRAFGFNVDGAGGPGGFETCFVVANCVAGNPAEGADLGLFNTGIPRGSSIAVSPVDGDVYIGDQFGTFNFGDRRVMRFDVPANPSALVAPIAKVFRQAALFVPPEPSDIVTSGPSRVAVDANGIVYAAGFDSRLVRWNSATNTYPMPFTAPGTINGLVFDPATEHLLVSVNPSGAAPSEIIELDVSQTAAEITNAEIVDRHIPNSGDFESNAFGFDPDNDKFYVSTSTGHRILVADADGATPPQDFTLDPAANVSADSAELSGAVDPNGPAGFPTAARWEVRREADADWTPVGSFTSLGDGSAFVDLDVTATNLEPGASYRARIVAHKTHNADAFSSEIVFTTEAVPPNATTLAPQTFTDTTAHVLGAVNPRGGQTTYRFEYVSEEEFAEEGFDDPAVAPAGGGDAGANAATKFVVEQIEGLEPETAYRYRVVAESAKGKAIGAERTLITRAPIDPSPERAYEQVTPPEKLDHGGPPNVSADGAARNGSAIAFDSKATIPGVGQEFGNHTHAPNGKYAAHRSDEGWTTRAILPRTTHEVLGRGLAAIGGHDFSKALLKTQAGWFADPSSVGGLYLRDLSSGANTLLGAGIVSATGSSPQTIRFAAATPDMSAVLFESTDQQTSDPGAPASGWKLYQWTDGGLSLVSFDVAGTPFATEVSAKAITEDGEDVFFSTPPATAATKIYRRSEGSTTTLVSPSKRTPVDPLGEKAKTYRASSVDGERVFFTSAEQLTDDANTGPARAGSDLYRYDVDADQLLDVSAETNTANGSRVQGILGASDDGEWIYYVAQGQVLAGQGVAGQPNLYLWHDDGSAEGQTRFIATLSGSDDTVYADKEAARRSRVSTDGQTAVFQSSADLSGYPNGGQAQIFAYEAEQNGGAGALSCISCGPDGAPAQSATQIGAQTASELSGGEEQRTRGETDLPRALSADGERVFFDTATALVPEDANGVRDVYEWRDGTLELISSGQSDTDSTFADASANGNDVFFFTKDRLVGQDYDALLDIYTARVGGGLASQFPQPKGELCQGDECKPQTDGPPAATPSPPSGETKPGGNYTRPFEIAKLSAGQLRSLANRGRVSLRIRVDQPGRLVVRALRGKQVMGSASKALKEPGITEVPLRLSPKARRTLSKEGRLKLRLEISFAGERQTASISLNRANRNRGRGK